MAAQQLGNLSCDAKALHPWAKKAPKPKDTAASASSSSTVNHSKLMHECLVSIADKLAKYPQFIQDVHTILFSSQYPIPKDRLGAGVWVDNSYTTVGRIPKEWMAGWLAQRLASEGLTPQLLAPLEEDDSENMHLLFEAETQLPLGTSLPPAVRSDEYVASKWLTARADDVGSRLKVLLKGGQITATKVNMKKASFEIVFGKAGEDEVVTHIKHLPSNTTVACPSHLLLLRNEFTMKNNHLDGMSSIEKHPMFHYLYTFFDPPTLGFRRSSHPRGNASPSPRPP